MFNIIVIVYVIPKKPLKIVFFHMKYVYNVNYLLLLNVLTILHHSTVLYVKSYYFFIVIQTNLDRIVWLDKSNSIGSNSINIEIKKYRIIVNLNG